MEASKVVQGKEGGVNTLPNVKIKGLALGMQRVLEIEV
jgi:hypothetical protein